MTFKLNGHLEFNMLTMMPALSCKIMKLTLSYIAVIYLFYLNHYGQNNMVCLSSPTLAGNSPASFR